MTLLLETTLTMKDLESYIKAQLDDPRYSHVDCDPILDIILHAKRRIAGGAYIQRVISEAMVNFDEYILCEAGYYVCGD
ncbi:hypothetical protein MLD52_07625 [Puniceicoccaceae bacterium K14]|nr:hypothetical protein [Puniceicoccaceae bacterium K14]